MRWSTILILTFISTLMADPLIDLTMDWDFFVGYDGDLVLGYSHTISYPVFPVDPIVSLTGCDPALLKAIMKAESDFHIHALSKTGAMGVAQFVPTTADWIGLSNPFDPLASTFKLCDYLEYLSKKFDTREEILWAYHDGEGRVRRYGPTKVGRVYAEKVLEYYREYSESGETEMFKDRIRLGFSISVPSLRASFWVSGSILGVLDYGIRLTVSDGIRYRASAYLRLSDEIAPFIEYDGSVKGGVSYRLRWVVFEYEPFSPRFRIQLWSLGIGFDKSPFLIYSF